MAAAADQPLESECMLRHEQKELSKRSQELSVAKSELTSLRENRRTYLKAGEIFFLRPQPVTLQAVTGARVRACMLCPVASKLPVAHVRARALGLIAMSLARALTTAPATASQVICRPLRIAGHLSLRSSTGSRSPRSSSVRCGRTPHQRRSLTTKAAWASQADALNETVDTGPLTVHRPCIQGPLAP